MKINNYMSKLGLALGLCAGLAGAQLWVSSAYAGDSLQVIGEGTVYYQPNQVTLSFSVQTESLVASKAVSDNATLMKIALDRLDDLKHDGDTIVTQGYSLNTYYEFNQTTRQQELKGYRAVNRVAFTSSQMEDIGSIIDSLSAAGVNQFDSILFTHNDSSQYKDKAMAYAVADAQHKAKLLAKSADVKLGSPEKIIDSPIQAPGLYGQKMDGMMRMSAESVQANTPIRSGDLSVTHQVLIEYEIND